MSKIINALNNAQRNQNDKDVDQSTHTHDPSSKSGPKNKDFRKAQKNTGFLYFNITLVILFIFLTMVTVFFNERITSKISFVQNHITAISSNLKEQDEKINKMNVVTHRLEKAAVIQSEKLNESVQNLKKSITEELGSVKSELKTQQSEFIETIAEQKKQMARLSEDFTLLQKFLNETAIKNKNLQQEIEIIRGKTVSTP